MAEFEFLGMRAVMRSPQMLGLLDFVKRIAQTNAAVLITGESGTGKEVIARALHHYSLRCTRPWIDVNCGSLPEHLIESELFGYEKGAFSGADAQKQGLFELAHAGTLFLDEIGDLEPRTQVKLLRVLDGASYYRLGGLRKISVDVRVVAATNKDLEKEVAAGRFRSDLYHRISQLRIAVPPLRERPEDAAVLAQFFLREFNPDLRLAPAAIQAICRHSWPGNVRELRNTILHAALTCDGEEITASSLRFSGAEAAPADFNLDSMEQRMISSALVVTCGHQQRAAELLGISQRTLNRKLKRFRAQPLAAAV